MAKNKKQAGARSMDTIAIACSDPAVPVSGDPVRFGNRCGAALINEQSDGLTTVDITTSEWDFSVKGVNAGGNSAVALYDELYYVDADTPKLSKKNTGVLFGMALATVGSGLTATIRVLKYRV